MAPMNAYTSKNLFLVGFMASGKTVLGKQLAKKLSRPFIDLDAYIEEKNSLSIVDYFARYGEDKFRREEANCLREIIESEKEPFVLSTGGGTPCFYNNMKEMNENGLTFFINPPLGILLSRLHMGKEKRPLLQQMNTAEFDETIRAKIEARMPFYTQSAYTLGDKNITVDHFINILENV